MLRIKTQSYGSDQLALITALENASVNVMIADCNRRIIFMNEALKSFLSNAEKDIQTDLPHFKVEGLIGQTIDVFHKNPEHQKAMLSRMDRRLDATIAVGGVMFDLIAKPLTDHKGKRIGTMVEWIDAARRIALADFEAQVNAIGEFQAVIQFDLDGTILDANKNFLTATGYELDDIVGQHHRIFCDPTYAASPDYEAFWEQLRRGQHSSGEYKRFHKDGRPIWISAIYAPLRDSNGDFVKVAKFATDITAEMEARQRREADQKEIWKDLEQIAMSVSTASGQAGQASSAAQQTSDNVQTVAAGIEELVGSVREINQQVVEANAISQQASNEAENTNAVVSGLSEAAQEISNVIRLISDIAEQTNLLALNATIEAARAGDAGRGFAVVAAEVKSLANQTAKATEEISSRINAVQNSTSQAVTAIGSISQTIAKVNEISSIIAAAVEEQSATTSEMSQSMQIAAGGVQQITDGVRDIAEQTRIIDASTNKVQKVSARMA
ncbi:MAG: PAS domain-containing methyl-accepting chemotaxis protein [Pseudomonadota bacterium]